MRLGMSEQTVLVALAHAVALTPPKGPAEGESAPKLPKGEALQELLSPAAQLVTCSL